MLRFVFAIPLLIHGLAHISGFLASQSRADVGFRTNSWIFSDSVYLHKGPGRVFGILWLLAMGCFIAGGMMVLFRQSGWTIYAFSGAVLSLISIVPWWRTVPAGAKIGAIFDLILMVLLFSPLEGSVKYWIS